MYTKIVTFLSTRVCPLLKSLGSLLLILVSLCAVALVKIMPLFIGFLVVALGGILFKVTEMKTAISIATWGLNLQISNVLVYWLVLSALSAAAWAIGPQA